MTNICIIKYLGERNNGKERRKSIEPEHYLNQMKDINQNIPDGSIQHIKKRDNFWKKKKRRNISHTRDSPIRW